MSARPPRGGDEPLTFFISYASPDRAIAERLYVLLARKAAVYLAVRSLRLGDHWDQELAAAQQRAEITLVLVSEHTHESFYQREEIAAAIEMERRGPHRVVPLWLSGNGRSFSIPYGLRVKQGLDVPNPIDLTAVTARLLDECLGSKSATSRRVASQPLPVGDARAAGDGTVVSSSDTMVSPGQDPVRAGRDGRGLTFTGRWRHTPDGSVVGPLMDIAMTAMPGFVATRERLPFVRFGVCISCDALSSDASSSEVRTKFVNFLANEPVAGLISTTAHLDHMRWIPWAGNGALRIEAVLQECADEARASAMLLLPVAGMQLHEGPDRIARLWLHIAPPTQGGIIAQPVLLAEWHSRLGRAMMVATAFAQFLTKELGLSTWALPPASLGVMIRAQRSISELVDTGKLAALPGASQATQFLSYAVADRDGESSDAVARAMLRQLCDHTMHLHDFEPVLAALDGRNADPEQVLQERLAEGKYGARRKLASLLESQGRTEEGEQLLRQGVAVDEPYSYWRLAAFFERHGKAEEAAQVRRDAWTAASGPRSAGRMRPKSVLPAYGFEPDQAEMDEQFWRTQLAEGNDAKARRELSGSLLAQGKIEEVAQLWRNALDVGDPDARWRLVRILEVQNKADEIERVLRDGLAQGESSARTDESSARTDLARHLESLGKFQEVEELWRDRVTAGEPGCRTALAQFLHRHNRLAEAESAYRDALAVDDPGGAGPGLARLLRDQNRFEEADQVWPEL